MKFTILISIVIASILLTPTGFTKSPGEDGGEGDSGPPANESKIVEDSELLQLDAKNLTPEELIPYIHSKLNELRKQLTGFENIYRREGLGPQNVESSRAFTNAQEDFKRREWQSTIRNLNHYLNASQAPETEEYLKAQYMLGKSYLALKEPHKAYRAFARYLSTLTTQPSSLTHEAIEVTSHILSIVETTENSRQMDLNQLMAALTSLDFAKPQKAWIYFYAGKSARISGKDTLALTWLNRAIETTENSRLKARARYNRSLVLIRSKRYLEATEDLKFALDSDKESSFDYREWAKLSLARIYVHLRKPQTALNHYSEVNQDAPLVYQEALFEKIYIFLALDEPKEAILAAEEYLLRFPLSTQAYKIRTMKSYFELKAGSLDHAKKTIDQGNARLVALHNWMQKNYGDRSTLTLQDVSGIIRATLPEVSQPPIIQYGQRLFHRLKELSNRIGNLRNDLRHLIFTAGKVNTSTLNPHWNQRIKQLSKLLEKISEAGDALSQAETALYKDRLNSKDKIILKSAHYRRQRSFSEAAKFSRRKGPWKEWALLGHFNQRSYSRHRQIKALQAELAALRYLSKTAPITGKKARQSELTQLQHESNLLESDLLRAIEISRSRQTLTAVTMSDLFPLKILIKDLAQNFFAEKTLLADYRQNYIVPQQMHLSQDLDKNWQLWQYLLETLFTQVIDLEKDMRRDILLQLKTFDKLISDHDRLLKQLEGTHKVLSRTLGKHLGIIRGHYASQIQKRLSKNKKWLADIKWLTFERTKSENLKVIEKYQLEQQILEENLKDLEQGVLWQWP